MPNIDEYTINNKSVKDNPKTLGPVVPRNFLKKSKFFLADEENLPMDTKLFSQMIEHAGGIITCDSSQKSGKLYMIGKFPKPGNKVYNANWIMLMMMKGCYVKKESYVCKDDKSADSDEKSSQPIALLSPGDMEECKTSSTSEIEPPKIVPDQTTNVYQAPAVVPLHTPAPFQIQAYPPLQRYPSPVYMQAPYPPFYPASPYNPGYPQYQQVAPSYPQPGFALQPYPTLIPPQMITAHQQPHIGPAGMIQPPPQMYHGQAQLHQTLSASNAD